MQEEHLLTGAGPTNRLRYCQLLESRCASHITASTNKFIAVMPTSLRRRNFDLETSHVLPLIGNFTKQGQQPGYVELWVLCARRNFCLSMIWPMPACFNAEYNNSDIINVGTGEDLAIAELAALVGTVVGLRVK